MYRITNIEEINEKYSRKLGNQVIIDISDFVRKSISNDYLFIRYMGPKFVIVFSGVDIDSVTTFVTDMKNGTKEDLKEVEEIKQKSEKRKQITGKQKTRYDSLVETWTVRDPLKREIAKKNELNYLEFFTFDEVIDWLNEQ